MHFDRVDPPPFSLDIGTTEKLVLNANGGDDVITSGNGLSSLISLTIDGGAGNDTITGGDGADLLLGGDGNDLVAGGRRNDIAFMGSGNDTFVWNPGDGSDTVDGQDGIDTLLFNGSNINENITISANGDHALLFRDIANVTMDTSNVETLDVDRDVIRGATLMPTRILRMMWNNTLNLTNHGLGPALLAVGVVISAAAVAQNAAPAVVAVTPAEMKWSSQGPLAAPGMEQLNLVGDPVKPGPYTLRLKFPKGLKIAPHTHPDYREVTILSGVFATGYGEKFDAANLKILPAGSFYSEPANVPHYIEIKEDVVLQVSGIGPSERRLVNPPDSAKQH